MITSRCKYDVITSGDAGHNVPLYLVKEHAELRVRVRADLAPNSVFL